MFVQGKQNCDPLSYIHDTKLLLGINKDCLAISVWTPEALLVFSGNVNIVIVLHRIKWQ